MKGEFQRRNWGKCLALARQNEKMKYVVSCWSRAETWVSVGYATQQSPDRDHSQVRLGNEAILP
jgi:hypothetical protein